jgi:GH15 family glucan-1,4-alpha-glucosidase
MPPLDGTPDATGAALSYAVMRGLTSAGGGMVAAATTSLLERAEQGRNYDYRYVWIRDQAYAGQAAAASGGMPLLDKAVEFITARLVDHGAQLAPAYRTDGTAIPDQRSLNLPGYPGGYDLVGNHVNQQFQLDAFGEALLLLSAAATHDRVGPENILAAQTAARAIEARWRQPDAGIWEIDNRPWTHSRLICAAGLRQAARAFGPHDTPDIFAWSSLADRIVADTAATSIHPDGYWRRSPDDRAVDAALLFPALRGAIPPTTPAVSPPSTPCSTCSPNTGTPTGSATGPSPSPTPKAHSPSAGSPPPSRSTNKATPSRRPDGSSGPPAAPVPLTSTPRNGTSTNTKRAATYPKRLCTPCTS